MKIETRLLKFFLVGGLNTLFGYSVYALFIYAGLHYSIASLFSTVLGVLFNFKTTGVLVFKSRDNRLIYKFVGVYVVGYAVNVGLLKILHSIGVDPYVSGAILLLPLAMLSYVLLKKFVFKESAEPE